MIVQTFSSPVPGVPSRCSGMAYDKTGVMTALEVSTVRVEHAPSGRTRLFADDTLVRDGDLYRDGRLTVRVSQSDPSIEVS